MPASLSSSFPSYIIQPLLGPSDEIFCAQTLGCKGSLLLKCDGTLYAFLQLVTQGSGSVQQQLQHHLHHHHHQQQQQEEVSAACKQLLADDTREVWGVGAQEHPGSLQRASVGHHEGLCVEDYCCIGATGAESDPHDWAELWRNENGGGGSDGDRSEEEETECSDGEFSDGAGLW